MPTVKYSVKDINIPWTRDQKGFALLIKNWQQAKDAQDFMKRHSLDQKQFVKTKIMIATARVHIPTLKKHRLQSNSRYDWEILKKVASEFDS